MTQRRIAGTRQRAEQRGRWDRTWQNAGNGDFLMNSPDGWVVDRPDLRWRGSDNLAQLLAEGSGGFTTRVVDGITYNIPNSPRDAAGLPAVGRATGLIADTLACLPWRVMRGRESLDVPRWISDPQLARPDDRIVSSAMIAPATNVTFWTQVITSQLWYGVAFVWTPSRDVAGAPKPPLYVINPGAITVRQYPRDGYPAGIYLTASNVEIPPDEVVVLPGAGPYLDGCGQGVLTRYARTMLGAEIIDAYARDVFGSGVPAGYLKSTNPNITEPQADALKAKWLENHGAGNVRSIAVLNASTEFTPIAFSPVDAALIEAGAFTIQQIALAFGLEPYLLGQDQGSSTYANVVDRRIDFRTLSLLPWARRLEASLSALLPAGTNVSIDFRGLLRGDDASRFAAYKIGLDGGWLTVDEVRELEDLDPLPEPDVVEPPAPPQLVVVPPAVPAPNPPALDAPPEALP